MVLIRYAELKDPGSFREVDAFLPGFPPDLRRKISAYKFAKDAQLCLYGKLLIRQIAREMGYPGDILPQIRYSTYSRPYVADEAADFNTSHSGSIVAVAMSSKGRLGIDIEAIRAVELSDFKGYFPEAEFAEITASADPLRSFYKQWTRKEALMKADGRGMHLELSKIEIEGNEGRIGAARWFLTPLHFGNNYSAHLATAWQPAATEIQIAKSEFHP